MTTEPTDGGPAFPTLHIPGQSPPGWSGISLRDYFAAAAMSSCIQKEGINISAAKEAYWIADAMLAARSIENPAEEIAALKRERDELLEALKHVTACLESYVPESDDEHRFCTQARAAIAKAEGRAEG